MGIKDRVLDILFDDEDELESGFKGAPVKREKKNYNASSFLDTGSIFIDATSPLPKTNNQQRQPIEDTGSYDKKPVNDNEYQFSENISPIFGVIDPKNKKSKNISKVKSYNDFSSKNFEPATKNQTPTYTSVVISPIYGPISTKPVKRTSKPRKKAVDPFERDITDTGSFDTIIDEHDTETIVPDFEEPKEEVIELTETIGDTDRLTRISDKINKIKNEAANIYSEDSSSDETIDEDGYQVETIEHENISDLIHSVQKYDGKINHIQHVHAEEPVIEEPSINEPVIEEVQESTIQPQIEDVIETVEELKENTSDFSLDSFKTEETVDQESSSNVEESDIFDDKTDVESVLENQKFTNDIEGLEETNEFSEVEVINEVNTDTIEESVSEAESSSQTSVDDIFQDEDDVEEGKDLFSVLFGDE